MAKDLFLWCDDKVKKKYLEMPELSREYQARLEGDLQYCVMDIETTGLDPHSDRIIEVAVIKGRGSETVDTFHKLIDPGMPIPFHIKLLTGIDEEMISGKPAMDQIIDDLADFLGDDLVVAYSYFEKEFLDILYPEFGRGRFTNPYLDVMDLALILLPSIRGHRQIDLASIWGIDTGTVHRAFDDTQTLFSVFNILLNGLYNADLSLIKALLEHSTGQGDGLAQLMKRVLDERSGGRKVDRLSLERVVRKTMLLKGISPQKGERADRPVPPEDVRSMFEPDGPIAGQFENYEERREQYEMAEAVRSALSDQELLLVEAGTGTGKSIAYLAPGVLWSKANDSPVVVSTRTLNLQDQLYTKDLPLLEEAMGEGSFRYSVLKGYGNYICLRKLQDLVGGKRKLNERQIGIFGMLLSWISENEFGDVSLLNVSYLRGLDNLVLSDFRECPGGKCKFARNGCCFYRRAVERAKYSHIVVVNHSLLLGGIGIEFRAAVIDEAHTLEDVATEQFTREFAYRDVNSFLKSLYSPVTGNGFIADLLDNVKSHIDDESFESLKFKAEEAMEAVELSLETTEEAFIALCCFYEGDAPGRIDIRFGPGQIETVEYTRLQMKSEDVQKALDKLVVQLSRVAGTIREKGDDSERLEYALSDLSGKAARAAEMKEDLDVFLTCETDELVRWATVSKEGWFESQALRVTPVDIGEHLQMCIYEDLDSVIMTSATLTVKNSFDFFRSRVGLGPSSSYQPETIILQSSFDYDRQMQILVVHDMPDPSSKDYSGKVAQVLKEIIPSAGGGALVLFTNRKLMINTYDEVAGELVEQGMKLLCQREGYSRRRLAEEFVEDENTSLFGTSSFWEGVDARGDTLKLVVVTRIPFESPGRPVFEARGEQIRQSGGSDFAELGLPMAALRLKQGVGRLIRTRQDRGQVIILDSRINKRRYGQVLLRTLPHALRRNVSEEEVGRAIKDFFSSD
ncbi:MAG: hypothetical protein JW738_06955 [Actinobacteria bacterium]|nr:hypothetical protein [Actinomycetota bacterium]